MARVAVAMTEWYSTGSFLAGVLADPFLAKSLLSFC